jgi:ketosteroid isomerase-like protein
MDIFVKAISDIEKSIVKYFNEKNVNGILSFFIKKFVGFSSTRHDRLTNLGQLRKTFLYYLKEGDKVTYSINDLKVHIYGELALATFYWKVTIRKGKKIKSVNGRGSHVFMMQDEGWKIVHEHYSKTH